MRNLKDIIKREDGFVYRIDVIKYLMGVLDNQVSTDNALWMMTSLEMLIGAIEKEEWPIVKLLAEKIWNEKASSQGR